MSISEIVVFRKIYERLTDCSALSSSGEIGVFFENAVIKTVVITNGIRFRQMIDG